jgi:hypothetical protein
MLQRRKQLRVLLYNHFKEEFFGSHRIHKQNNKNTLPKKKDGIIMTGYGETVTEEISQKSFLQDNVRSTSKKTGTWCCFRHFQNSIKNVTWKCL